MQQAGRIQNAQDVVKRGQDVYVKVLSSGGSKTSLSMREVDQDTGEDLNPRKQEELTGDGSDWSNPSGPSVVRKPVTNLPAGATEEGPSRPIKRLSSPEKWEAKQLIAAGVLDVRDYPNFDDEHGLLNVEETEEELEIELNEEVPCCVLFFFFFLFFSFSLFLFSSFSLFLFFSFSHTHNTLTQNYYTLVGTTIFERPNKTKSRAIVANQSDRQSRGFDGPSCDDAIRLG